MPARLAAVAVRRAAVCKSPYSVDSAPGHRWIYGGSYPCAKVYIYLYSVFIPSILFIGLGRNVEEMKPPASCYGRVCVEDDVVKQGPLDQEKKGW